MEKRFYEIRIYYRIRIYNRTRDRNHYHENFEMLYVISGTVEVSVEEESWKLQSEDMIIINASRNHSLWDQDMLLARFLFIFKIKALLGKIQCCFVIHRRKRLCI